MTTRKNRSVVQNEVVELQNEVNEAVPSVDTSKVDFSQFIENYDRKRKSGRISNERTTTTLKSVRRQVLQFVLRFYERNSIDVRSLKFEDVIHTLDAIAEKHPNSNVAVFVADDNANQYRHLRREFNAYVSGLRASTATNAEVEILNADDISIDDLNL